MKKQNLALAAIIFTLGFSQSVYAEDVQKNSTQLVDPIPSIYASPIPEKTKMQDKEILSMIKAVDLDEIQAAKSAEKKNISKKVMDYAKMMITHHNSNIKKVEEIEKSMVMNYQETSSITSLRQQNVADLAKINELNGKEFEKAYLDMMIKDHTNVLGIIDKQLLPSVEHDKIRNHLTATRANVASHMAAAALLLKEIK